ncbi:MAG: hypothetical protein SXA11_22490 [Cyanobacteriota bacterium]|nr:hypothetical protein [Cyanobacteriota bacterium]
MADEAKIKQFLAYWFQLGKGVAIKNGEKILKPQAVITGDRYSREFEECWQKVVSPDSGDCYLEGSSQSIAELLSPQWEILACSRCEMPVPVRSQGMPPESCPCFDLPDWPDYDKPQPRSPVDSKSHLSNICQRLVAGAGEEEQLTKEESELSCPLELIVPKETALNSQTS